MMDFEEPDIIMVGAQSQSVQNGFGNTSLYNQRQHELILATQPDAYILCVSCEDEYEYVLRTISYLESINNAKVLCLMVFPLVYSNVDGYLTGKPKRVSEQKLNNYIELLGEVCQLPIFVQDKEESIRNVIDIIEGEFAENEC